MRVAEEMVLSYSTVTICLQHHFFKFPFVTLNIRKITKILALLARKSNHLSSILIAWRQPYSSRNILLPPMLLSKMCTGILQSTETGLSKPHYDCNLPFQ
jgi:hypothetical protein